MWPRCCATSRALALMPELDDILHRISQLSNPAVFDPLSSERAFRIACSDYEITTLLVPLVQQLRESAPSVRLHLLNGGDLGVGCLENKVAELALLSPEGTYLWAKRKLLLRESFLTLLPKSALPLTKDRYLNLQHVVLATDEPEPNPVDAPLGRHQRHIACRARSFASAIELACAAHWALNVPARLIERMQLPQHMCVMKPVIDVPDFEVAMYWHTQTDKDPGLQWLRGAIAALASSI